MEGLKIKKKKQTIKLELPYDPTLSLLGTYPEKTLPPEDICTLMFTATLFTIAKTQKQPKCPSADKRGKGGVIHLYNGILLGHKKE